MVAVAFVGLSVSMPFKKSLPRREPRACFFGAGSAACFGGAGLGFAFSAGLGAGAGAGVGSGAGASSPCLRSAYLLLS